MFVCMKVCLFNYAKVEIWPLVQVHVLSGQARDVRDAFGFCVFQEETKLERKCRKEK